MMTLLGLVFICSEHYLYSTNLEHPWHVVYHELDEAGRQGWFLTNDYTILNPYGITFPITRGDRYVCE